MIKLLEAAVGFAINKAAIKLTGHRDNEQYKDIRLNAGRWLFETPQENFFVLKSAPQEGEELPWLEYGYLSFGETPQSKLDSWIA